MLKNAKKYLSNSEIQALKIRVAFVKKLKNVACLCNKRRNVPGMCVPDYANIKLVYFSVSNMHLKMVKIIPEGHTEYSIYLNNSASINCVGIKRTVENLTQQSNKIWGRDFEGCDYYGILN